MATKDQEKNIVILKGLFGELIDSVTFSDEYASCLNEYTTLTEKKENYTTNEKKLYDDLQKLLDNYYKKEKLELFLPYKQKLNDFLNTTLNDYLSSLISNINKEISDKQRECDAYVQKVKTNLQSFLMNDPFNSVSSEIACQILDGKYNATQTVTCNNNIAYKFSLDTSEVEFLRSKASGSKLSKGLKIPVRAGKKWLSSKMALDFEKFDPYFLNRAVLTSDLLTLEFKNDELASSLTFETTQSGKRKTSVFYKDEVQNIEITANQDLLSGLNQEAVNSISNQLEIALNFLAKYRTSLLSLTVKNVEMLTSMKIFDFLYAASQNLSKQLGPLIVGILSGSEVVEGEQSEAVTKDYINKRLSLLGTRSTLLKPLLGLPTVSIVKDAKKKNVGGPLNLK